MARIPFSKLVSNSKIDIRKEYDRLYSKFYLEKHGLHPTNMHTLREVCEWSFSFCPFRGTCVSLEDFDETNNISFERIPAEVDIDYLVSFCEYSYNLAIYSQNGFYGDMLPGFGNPAQEYLQQVLVVIDKIGYRENERDGITDFVQKDMVANVVAGIVDADLSYRVIEYNHRSMKGDLESKKAVLRAFYDKLEPQRPTLNTIDSALADNLFFLFNNVNIRHNNTDVNGGKNYHPKVAKMNKTEIENWYDDTYQLCLQAFLELENEERKVKAKKLKEEIKTNKQ